MIAARYFLAISLFLLAGCATGFVRSKELNKPLKEIQGAVVEALPLGRLKTSRNGRTFYSNYFRPDGTKFRSAKRSAKRYQAVVTVLGDRRPYVLEVSVKKEEATGYDRGSLAYVSSGNVEGLARIVMQRIQKNLAKRRKDRNIIDDFRIF